MTCVRTILFCLCFEISNFKVPVCKILYLPGISKFLLSFPASQESKRVEISKFVADEVFLTHELEI